MAHTADFGLSILWRLASAHQTIHVRWGTESVALVLGIATVIVPAASPLVLIHTEFFLFGQDCGNWPAMAVDTQAVLVAAF